MLHMGGTCFCINEENFSKPRQTWRKIVDMELGNHFQFLSELINLILGTSVLC